MSEDTGFLNRLRERGQEYLTQVSAELSQNPRFMQAVAGATRSELKRAVARIDALEKQLAAQKRARPKAAKSRDRARKPSRKAAG
jgi:hypothetical protein